MRVKLTKASNPKATELVSLAKSDLKKLDEAVKTYTDKIENIPKKNQEATLEALQILTELANSAMLYAQPYLVNGLKVILNATGDKRANAEVKTAAAECVKAICNKMSPNALQVVLPFLHEAIHFESRWQTRVVGLQVLADFSNHAPDQLGFALPQVIPEVSQCIVDLKVFIK